MRVIAFVAALAVLGTACSSGERGRLTPGPGPTGPAVPPSSSAPAAQAPHAASPKDQAAVAQDPPVEAPPLPLDGCPPPPRPPGMAQPPPAYVPPHLVPEDQLPTPLPPGPWPSNLGPLGGKGMWIWKYKQTEGGNPDAIVDRAVKAGLRQLWVRVGDSADRFYAKDVLDELVPRAHRRGIAVIGWGFPYLFDPVSDAGWAADVLAWRGPKGDQLDGFSPDLELTSEGVAVSEKRTTVFLDLVRRSAGARLVVATVYRPTDRLWPNGYHYAAIAPYVDAFAPMVYWNCVEPGAAALQAIERLQTLRPVHTIGQAYDGSDSGSRGAAPNAQEIRRFLDVSRRQGALGSSFWVWQHADDEEWNALASFPWPPGG